jgi:hypothetical protein
LKLCSKIKNLLEDLTILKKFTKIHKVDVKVVAGKADDLHVLLTRFLFLR